MAYGNLIAATVMTLGVYAKVIRQLQVFFYTDKCVVRSLLHSRASCSYSCAAVFQDLN